MTQYGRDTARLPVELAVHLAFFAATSEVHQASIHLRDIIGTLILMDVIDILLTGELQLSEHRHLQRHTAVFGEFLVRFGRLQLSRAREDVKQIKADAQARFSPADLYEITVGV